MCIHVWHEMQDGAAPWLVGYARLPTVCKGSKREAELNRGRRMAREMMGERVYALLAAKSANQAMLTRKIEGKRKNSRRRLKRQRTGKTG